MNRLGIPLAILLLGFFYACQETQVQALPKIGNMEINGKDTLFHTIPEFSFVDQDSNVVTNETLSEYIYITDFFFTSCPSICPVVMKNMITIHEAFKDHEKVLLVSHTIDPKRDTPTHLKRYAANLGVDQTKWKFLTGDKDALLDMADEYFVVAIEDPEAPGGFDHSGKIILTDTNGHIRAFCEGTDADEVKQFIPKVNQLLKEYE